MMFPANQALKRTVIIEGTGVLHPALVGLYDLKIYVESDWASALPALLARDGDTYAREWQNMFIPSDNIYLETKPQQRADIIAIGRDAGLIYPNS